MDDVRSRNHSQRVVDEEDDHLSLIAATSRKPCWR